MNTIATEKTLRKTQEYIDAGYIAESERDLINRVAEDFVFAITPSIQKKIKPNDVNDPIAMQFVPTAHELTVAECELADPIGDELHTEVKGIIHRYPDRCLFTPVHICAAYCRFCFRRQKVGFSSETLKPADLKEAFRYIKDHKEIWEVILTGGDPLVLQPSQLTTILQELDQIEHVEVVRIHTRIPSVDPQRITADMVNALKLRNKPVYLIVHINHPNEFSPEVECACAALVDAGIPLLSQTVLLKSINDNIDVLGPLMRKFIKNRIKPYYLHHADLVRGTSHFRTTIKVGQELMQQLRGRYSGLCQPTYVLDIPGGYGKVPIQHNYIHEKSDDSMEYRVEDYQGNLHDYKTTL